MAGRLTALLSDGSTRDIALRGASPEDRMKAITELTPNPGDWIETEDGGLVRTSAIIAFDVDEPAEPLVA